jgi:hypothetical protein
MRFDDLAGNGPGRYCSPRHRTRGCKLHGIIFKTREFNLRVDDVASNICQAPQGAGAAAGAPSSAPETGVSASCGIRAVGAQAGIESKVIKRFIIFQI